MNSDILEKSDIHIHFPAGAVGKDGPSAGVTIVTVLTSLFSGRCVRSDTAMTGEITLRGQVLPVRCLESKNALCFSLNYVLFSIFRLEG